MKFGLSEKCDSRSAMFGVIGTDNELLMWRDLTNYMLPSQPRHCLYDAKLRYFNKNVTVADHYRGVFETSVWSRAAAPNNIWEVTVVGTKLK